MAEVQCRRLYVNRTTYSFVKTKTNYHTIERLLVLKRPTMLNMLSGFKEGTSLRGNKQ